MKLTNLDNYRCPRSSEKLLLDGPSTIIDGEVIEGFLLSVNSNNKYPIINGVPDFTIYSEIEKNEYAVNLFKNKAKEYDKYQHLSFETFYQDETDVRNGMIDRLNLKSDSRVLEVNAGTGRDSILISKRLTKEGLLNVQDISRDMLMFCQEKLSTAEVPLEIHQGNASKLPYADNSFDAVYSFGGVGMNTYSNNKEAIAEMVRVTKLDGRIVFGGLSLAPWLRNTYFGKVLVNHNSHYANEILLNDLPIEARNLNLNWNLSGAGFVVDFTVGDGEPKANFEYEIPGPRGGTLLTRYTGNLEGVSNETKELAMKAREKLGISMHKWLNDLIKKEAEKILAEKGKDV
jgi:ubiquinone/menaquinone biosynthesis C-methylase UbiE